MSKQETHFRATWFTRIAAMLTTPKSYDELRQGLPLPSKKLTHMLWDYRQRGLLEYGMYRGDEYLGHPDEFVVKYRVSDTPKKAYRPVDKKEEKIPKVRSVFDLGKDMA